MQHSSTPSRRTLLKGVGGIAAAAALAGGTSITSAGPAAAGAGGLDVIEHQSFGRMQYYRVRTASIGWNPAINVLLPDDYSSGRRYPVLYLFHGGAQDFRKFDFEDNIRGRTAGRRLIVVMPDGGAAGWHCNPVSSNVGPRDWENFHINQLIPWVDANFRTYAEYNGRAVSGFSMGGFGALKYAAKYYGHFASVSSHSGPASLRRDFGAVVHWANTSSAAVELGGATVYGVPWDEGRVSMDNPVERIGSYRNKRIFLVAGTDGNDINERFVLPGQREFGAALSRAGIPHTRHEENGGHFVRGNRLQEDIDGVIARLRKA